MGQFLWANPQIVAVKKGLCLATQFDDLVRKVVYVLGADADGIGRHGGGTPCKIAGVERRT